MSTQELYPCDFDWMPNPPGETIVELLDYYGMSRKELADRIGYSLVHIDKVILGELPITSDLAVLLERVLGTSAQTWKNLESHYQISKAKRQKTDLALADTPPVPLQNILALRGG